MGGLVAQALVRLTLDGARVTGEERIALGARVRDLRQGPDGGVYVLTDESNGKLLRLTPAS
ncbi:Soluble aldose sugar dehydrogenase YliI precursor [compost metagenome]